MTCCMTGQRWLNSSSARTVPGEERPVAIALVHKRSLRLDFGDNKVIIYTEPVVVDSVSGLQILPLRVDRSSRMPIRWQEPFPRCWGVPLRLDTKLISLLKMRQIA